MALFDFYDHTKFEYKQALGKRDHVCLLIFPILQRGIYLFYLSQLAQPWAWVSQTVWWGGHLFYCVCVCVCVCVCARARAHVRAHTCMFSHVWLFATPWTVARQAPLSMGFSRQEYWSGLLCPPPGDLPDPGIKSASSALAGKFFITVPPGKPLFYCAYLNFHDSCWTGQTWSSWPWLRDQTLKEPWAQPRDTLSNPFRDNLKP